MKKLFVSYEVAKRLKELGFNDPCLAYHRELLGSKEPVFHIDAKNKPYINSELGDNKYNMVSAPLYQQVLDWLREKHNIEIYCPNYYKNTKGYKPQYECRVDGKQLSHPPQGHALGSVELFPTYYKALDRAIEEAIKLI